MFLIPQTEEENLKSNKKIYASLNKCLELRHKYISGMIRNVDNDLNLELLTLKTHENLKSHEYNFNDTYNKTSDNFNKDLKTKILKDNVSKNNSSGDKKIVSLLSKSSKITYTITNKGISLFLNNEEIKFPSFDEYLEDIKIVLNACYDRPTKSFAYRRLEHLKHNFLMYKNLYSDKEKNDQKLFSKCDFYTVIKVDTHVHHSACMNSKHLQKFIKRKLRCSGDEIVYQRVIKSKFSQDDENFNDNKVENYTLKDIFKLLGITEEKLRIDNLDTHAHTDTFHRFDRFNSKYNPLGQPILREIFLKYDNFIHGKYLAQITNETIQAINENKYVYVEYRISIYGKKREEWSLLADWIINNKLISSKVRWVIQIPRLYKFWKTSKNQNNADDKLKNSINNNFDKEDNSSINSFGDMLNNIFVPLFEVTRDPESNPNLSMFLKNVVGFDCVDDESIREKPFGKNLAEPYEYTFPDEPPYGYYLFHIYRNISMINCYRLSKGKNTFTLNPHSGEAGDWEHLAYAFLLSNSICHGVLLRKCLPLQYLYYLAQIGISMSPLSNNSLFIRLNKNPFPDFFSKGLKVTLTTDDPLQLHFTKEPLMEEYSVASQVWKLSSCDQCEIARNSVLISNFPSKEKWIGEYWKEGVDGNDITKTNISDLRIEFRYKMWKGEIDRIKGVFR
ncbi:AMP deaminase 2 [Dictyocoela muelleri]|nr:AMP deaminase 2 [Dictyocoela muelleri]